jgi:drug/metabolite transporter (DMT)-like permease
VKPSAPTDAEDTRRQRRLGVLLGTGGLLLMSLESPGLRLTRTGSWNNAFWLGLFGAASMLVWVRMATGASPVAAARGHVPATLLSGLLQTLSTLFFVFAIHHTSIANTQVIFATTPAIAALAALIAIRERTSPRTWLGIAGSMIGLSIVISGSFAHGRIVGDLCALIAVCSYAANLTLWRRHPALNRQVAVGLGGLGMALCALVPSDTASIDARALAILAGLGLVSAPLGRVFVASATRYLPVAQVSLLTPVETIAATTWAWLLLGEAPTITGLVGGVIVIGSLIVGLKG